MYPNGRDWNVLELLIQQCIDEKCENSSREIEIFKLISSVIVVRK